VKLSGSTDGKQIKVAASATPGTTIHTAHATALDEIWLWASNPDATTPYDLTIEWGGTSSPDDQKVFTIPPKFDVPIVKGLLLTNSLVVKAFGSSANKICISGFVNRIA
jgi:hypothetical protein